MLCPPQTQSSHVHVTTFKPCHLILGTTTILPLAWSHFNLFAIQQALSHKAVQGPPFFAGKAHYLAMATVRFHRWRKRQGLPSHIEEEFAAFIKAEWDLHLEVVPVTLVQDCRIGSGQLWVLSGRR